MACLPRGPLGQLLERLRQAHPASPCVAWRHFPDPDAHPHATGLALAAEVAATEARFWPMTRALLELRHDDPRDLHAAAGRAGVDFDRLLAFMRAGASADRVLHGVVGPLGWCRRGVVPIVAIVPAGAAAGTTRVVVVRTLVVAAGCAVVPTAGARGAAAVVAPEPSPVAETRSPPERSPRSPSPLSPPPRLSAATRRRSSHRRGGAPYGFEH